MLGEFGDLVRGHIAVPRQVVAHHGQAGGAAARCGDAAAAIALITPHGVPLQKQGHSLTAVVSRQIHGFLLPGGIVQHKVPGLGIALIQVNDGLGILAVGNSLFLGKGFYFFFSGTSVRPGEGHIPIEIVDWFGPQKAGQQYRRQDKQGHKPLSVSHLSYPPFGWAYNTTAGIRKSFRLV